MPTTRVVKTSGEMIICTSRRKMVVKSFMLDANFWMDSGELILCTK
jgi:hypothetical protein